MGLDNTYFDEKYEAFLERFWAEVRADDGQEAWDALPFWKRWFYWLVS